MEPLFDSKQLANGFQELNELREVDKRYFLNVFFKPSRNFEKPQKANWSKKALFDFLRVDGRLFEQHQK